MQKNNYETKTIISAFELTKAHETVVVCFRCSRGKWEKRKSVRDVRGMWAENTRQIPDESR